MELSICKLQDDPVCFFIIRGASKYFCPFYFLLAIMHSLAGSIRGTGKTVPPMVLMLIYAWKGKWMTET